jgi:hypothetical protein
MNLNIWGSSAPPPRGGNPKTDTTEKHYLETLLVFSLGDIKSMQKMHLNSGYPVTLLTMAMIETCSSILYKVGGKVQGKEVGHYFRDFFLQVSRSYSLQRHNNMCDSAQRLGELLYGFLRCKIAHDATAIRAFPVDAEPESYNDHLTMHHDGSIKIHAYHLFDDFLKTLPLVDQKAAENNNYRQIVESGILGYQARLERQSQEALLELSNARKPI